LLLLELELLLFFTAFSLAASSLVIDTRSSLSSKAASLNKSSLSSCILERLRGRLNLLKKECKGLVNGLNCRQGSCDLGSLGDRGRTRGRDIVNYIDRVNNLLLVKGNLMYFSVVLMLKIVGVSINVSPSNLNLTC